MNLRMHPWAFRCCGGWISSLAHLQPREQCAESGDKSEEMAAFRSRRVARRVTLDFCGARRASEDHRRWMRCARTQQSRSGHRAGKQNRRRCAQSLLCHLGARGYRFRKISAMKVAILSYKLPPETPSGNFSPQGRKGEKSVTPKVTSLFCGVVSVVEFSPPLKIE